MSTGFWKNSAAVRFFAIVLLLVAVLVTVGITYAQSTGNQVYSIAVNKAGAMRLLTPDGNGNFTDKPRNDETVIELPSRQMVLMLESRLNQSVSIISELQSLLQDQGNTIATLQEQSNNQTSLITALTGQATAQESTIDNLLAQLAGQQSTLNTLMARVNEQQAAIDDLTARVTFLEENGGGGGGGGPVIPPSAVLWMSGDQPAEPAVVNDLSQHVNNGVVSGAVWDTLPGGLWYLKFDGVDDSVDFGNHPSLNITDNLTVKVWALPESQRVAVVWVVGKDASGGRSFAYGMSASFFLWAQHSGWNVGSSPAALTPSHWHQIVYTYDASAAVFSFYIDGVLSRTIASPPAISPSSTGLFLGKRSYIGAEGYYKGSTALLEVHHAAWSAAEVQDSFNAEKARFGL